LKKSTDSTRYFTKQISHDCLPPSMQCICAYLI
jgi:hypothetical protein